MFKLIINIKNQYNNACISKFAPVNPTNRFILVRAVNYKIIWSIQILYNNTT